MNNFYVYEMFNSECELLYIGKTTNIKNRMTQHFSKEMMATQPWKSEVLYIDYFELETRIEMDILELYLIAMKNPKYNIQSTDTDVPKCILRCKTSNHRRMFRNKEVDSIKNLNVSCEDKETMRKLINIYEGKLNDIGCFNKAPKFKDKHIPLSRQWYMNSDESKLKKIRDNTYNYFRHICKKKCKDVIWTCDLDIKEKYAPKSYKKCYVAPNDDLCKFDNCKSFAYLINDFPTDIEKQYDEKDLLSIIFLIKVLKYVTLDLGNNIDVYIPSDRVRKLLINWLDE